jgi:hypothetical protein
LPFKHIPVNLLWLKLNPTDPESDYGQIAEIDSINVAQVLSIHAPGVGYGIKGQNQMP